MNEARRSKFVEVHLGRPSELFLSGQEIVYMSGSSNNNRKITLFTVLNGSLIQIRFFASPIVPWKNLNSWPKK